MAEFLNILDRNVVLGMGQAATAIALCFGVVMLCRRFCAENSNRGGMYQR